MCVCVCVCFPSFRYIDPMCFFFPRYLLYFLVFYCIAQTTAQRQDWDDYTEGDMFDSTSVPAAVVPSTIATHSPRVCVRIYTGLDVAIVVHILFSYEGYYELYNFKLHLYIYIFIHVYTNLHQYHKENQHFPVCFVFILLTY